MAATGSCNYLEPGVYVYGQKKKYWGVGGGGGGGGGEVWGVGFRDVLHYATTTTTK